MKIILNGNEKDVDDGTELFDLLSKLKISDNKQGVAVAINDDVIAKEEWKLIKLKQNDQIEIIRAVQGG